MRTEFESRNFREHSAKRRVREGKQEKRAVLSGKHVCKNEKEGQQGRER